MTCVMAAHTRDDLLNCLLGIWERGWVDCVWVGDEVTQMTVLLGNPLSQEDVTVLVGEDEVLAMLSVWFGNDFAIYPG